MSSRTPAIPKRRFVVERYYDSVDIYFVEAPDAADAKQRVFPDDPTECSYFEEWGGCDPPPFQAVIRDQRILVREVRRFPPGSIVFYGEPGQDRLVGPQGEPRRRTAA